MAFESTDVPLDDLERGLEALEKQCASSNLVIYQPGEEKQQPFYDLCQTYLHASDEQRAWMRTTVSDKPGIANHLLGYVYESAHRIHTLADREWLRIGLAAASLENCRFDYRDFLLALAELYVAAEAAGIHPRSEFKAVAALSSKETPRGGMTSVSSMLANFHNYGALKERQRRNQETSKGTTS